MPVNDFSIREVADGLKEIASVVEGGGFSLEVEMRLRCAEAAARRLSGVPTGVGVPGLTDLADTILAWVTRE